MPEEKVRALLVSRLGVPPDAVRIARPRRVFAEVPQERLRKALEMLKNEEGFTHLVAITGLDERERFAAIYHLGKEGVVVSIRVPLARENPSVASVMDLFPSAELYEREMKDLVGIDVSGLPPGNRYPLPDDWPAEDHPLRKDWKPEKGGVDER